eukprot:TRINITY_DN2807_c0_g1_i1.p4 TRINITY_DN2807_c0_g1~~TRINITY_DN2807_c0_g1_i1.p4  ORF type:complete len:121 (+),score=1.83 TRINITY_DN2807_c0_g1_i1:666-1028(+)
MLLGFGPGCPAGVFTNTSPDCSPYPLGCLRELFFLPPPFGGKVEGSAQEILPLNRPITSLTQRLRSRFVFKQLYEVRVIQKAPRAGTHGWTKDKPDRPLSYLLLIAPFDVTNQEYIVYVS